MCACTTLSRVEKAQLRELQSHGISDTEQRIKEPAVAAALNLLPGFGNFYLAIGTVESDHYGIGLMNLLLWPASGVWAIPEGAIDANQINRRETIHYYTVDPDGKAKLEALRAGRPVGD